VPRIDGLLTQPPSNLRRRCTELVAYLALHRPDGVPADRLLTRVLGSADHDARPKTLYNVASEARRWLGIGSAGRWLLPQAADGVYRLGPSPSVDAVEAVDLVRRGDRSDAATATDCYRRALEMIEGEVLGGVRRGYDWWSLEGHHSLVASALVAAASRLAQLATLSGVHDVDAWARVAWAVDRARMLERDNEALTRASMMVAACRGDVDGLRRIRRDWCQHGRAVPGDPASAEASGADLPPLSRQTTELFRRLVWRLHRGVPPYVSHEATTAALSLAPWPGGRRPCWLTAFGPQEIGDSRPLQGAPNGPVAQANLAAMADAPRSTVPSAPAAL
jgi:hypothetical protein